MNILIIVNERIKYYKDKKGYGMITLFSSPGA